MANRMGGMMGGVGNKKKKRNASEEYKKAMMNEKQLDHAKMEELFQDEFDKLVKATKRKASFGKKGEEQEMGDNTKAALEMIARRQAKGAFKQYKKEKDAKQIKIDVKSFTGMQGGRIDKNGRIYDSANQVILTVDMKTGKIKNKWGSTVGKYKAGSSYSEFSLAKLIDKYDSRKQKSFTMGAGVGGSAPQDGGVWGNGGGSVWGNNDDNNGGGFWG